MQPLQRTQRSSRVAVQKKNDEEYIICLYVVVVCCRHYHVTKCSRFIGQRLRRERKNRTRVYFLRRQDLESCVACVALRALNGNRTLVP